MIVKDPVTGQQKEVPDVQEKWHFSFIECNRRPQVENEALALLEPLAGPAGDFSEAFFGYRLRGLPTPYSCCAFARSDCSLSSL